jgi:triacylglycerol lipase
VSLICRQSRETLRGKILVMKWYLIPVYFVGEYVLIVFNHLKYLLLADPPSRWKIGNKGNVVLIQGLNSGWVILKSIGDSLNGQGYRVHVIKDLKTNTIPVLEGCERVKEYINEHRLKDIIVITHSKGGIIGLYLLKDPKVSKRIKKLITIACPFYGSVLAGLMPCAKELVPSSQLIKNALSGVNFKKIFSLYPRVDNHVVPNKNLIPDKVSGKQIDITGHTRILESEETMGEISAYLKILRRD